MSRMEQNIPGQPSRSTTFPCSSNELVSNFKSPISNLYFFRTGFVQSVLGACLTAVLASAACAQDWPMWGGTPARNMYSPAKGLPDHFVKGGKGDVKFKSGT